MKKFIMLFTVGCLLSGFVEGIYAGKSIDNDSESESEDESSAYERHAWETGSDSLSQVETDILNIHEGGRLRITGASKFLSDYNSDSSKTHKKISKSTRRKVILPILNKKSKFDPAVERNLKEISEVLKSVSLNELIPTLVNQMPELEKLLEQGCSSRKVDDVLSVVEQRIRGEFMSYVLQANKKTGPDKEGLFVIIRGINEWHMAELEGKRVVPVRDYLDKLKFFYQQLEPLKEKLG